MKLIGKTITKYFFELSTLATITILFLVINLFNIRSWYFSAIGDEYAFFNYAKEIAINKRRPNIFDQKGVYAVIPTLSSYYQASAMKILGINVFGWKASHAFIVATSIVTIYLLAKKLLGKNTAFIATVFYASSHLLWAYVHTGYSNIEALFPFIASLTLFSYQHFVLAGLFAAFGFYTYYTSRIIIIILISWTLISYKTINLRHSLPRLLLGFGILLMPFLSYNKTAIIQDMFNRSLVAQNDPTAYGPWHKFIFDNIIRNSISFWYNPRLGPYVSGSILDYATGLFLLAGLLITIARLKKSRILSLKLLTLFILPLLIVAITSPYGYPAISRLHIVIPGASLIAGLGAWFFIHRTTQPIIKKVSIMTISFLVIILNLHRFIIQTPKMSPSTKEAVAIKALTITCKHSLTPIVVGTKTKPLLAPAIDAYELNVKLIDQQELKDVSGLSNSDCIIFMNPESRKASSYINQLTNGLTNSQYYQYAQEKVSDTSGKQSVLVFTP